MSLTEKKLLKIAVMGTGKIAEMMAATLVQMKHVDFCAVASRTLDKAKAFASKYGVKRAYGSYEQLVADEEVQLVYIATPHSEHFHNALLCLNHGKHVLCEKAFTVNEKQARELIDTAREKSLLITEAMWVRYMPMAQTLKKVLDSGIIGEPMTVTANLCYLLDQVPRLLSPDLAGGALLDVGVYTLNFASLVFGDDILSVDSTVIKTETGVDAQNSITLCYPGGKMAVLNSSLRVLSDRQGVIYGTKGYVIVENINNFESISVYDTSRRLIETYAKPQQISGYEYQVEACAAALLNGDIECRQMPHSVTLAVMRTMDELRRQWGLRYPME